jgi:hypothetical protein
MHEVGYPLNGVPRDIHLAKRMYDDASALSRDAYVPVRLALVRMRMAEAVRGMADSWLVKEVVVPGINAVRAVLGNKPLWAPDTQKKDMRSKEEIKAEKQLHVQQMKQEIQRLEQDNERMKSRKGLDMKGNEVVAGSMIKARWKNGRTYYTGYLSKVNSDGSMNIQYDDGDMEQNIAKHLVQRVSTKTHPLYVQKGNNDQTIQKKKDEIAAATAELEGKREVRSSGKQEKGSKGWFTGSFVVQWLRWINWDIVGVSLVASLWLFFGMWLLRQLLTSPYWYWSVVALMFSGGMSVLFG